MSRSTSTIHLLVAVLCAVAACSIPSVVSAQVVQQYEYQSDRIYPIRTGLGITTQVELSPNEKVLDFSTGFSSGWELTRRENVFYLKPRNIDVDTNMMIRTTTRSYIFELKVVATDWKTLEQARKAGVHYKVKFHYPSDQDTSSPQVKTESVAQSAALLPGRNYNFDYDYATRNKRAPWLVPANVYDDGRFTYIKLKDLKQFPTGDFPAVFMREAENGEDSLVNTHVEGRTIVVQGTYSYLVIRHGDNVVGLRRSARK